MEKQRTMGAATKKIKTKLRYTLQNTLESYLALRMRPSGPYPHIPPPWKKIANQFFFWKSRRGQPIIHYNEWCDESSKSKIFNKSNQFLKSRKEMFNNSPMQTFKIPDELIESPFRSTRKSIMSVGLSMMIKEHHSTNESTWRAWLRWNFMIVVLMRLVTLTGCSYPWGQT